MATDSKKTKLADTIQWLALGVVALVLAVVVLQRVGVIGGAPVDQTIAAAVGVSSTPTMAPNKKNLKAYLSDDDPTVKITDIGPNRYQIIDIHEHAQSMVEAERLLKAMDTFGVKRTCLQSATIYTFTLNNKYGFEQYKENNEVLLQIKARWPDRFCAFVTVDPADPAHLDVIKDAVARGADGVKLYLGHGAATGKGPFHVMPIDDQRLEAFWAYAEDTQLPVLMHVNLIKFWDETISLLERHPYLRLCLPHFGLHKNTEARLARLGWIFDRYPNTFTDVSYGYYTFQVEGFESLAKWRSRSREYLQRYATRIMFASDMVLEPTKDLAYIDDTLRSYRQFHESKRFRLFLVPTAVMHGMDLDDETLRDIYENSSKRFLLLDDAGAMPDRREGAKIEAPRPAMPPLDKETIPHDPQYVPRAEGEAYASSATMAGLNGRRQGAAKASQGGGGEASGAGEADDGINDEGECH